jgi:hypothetical protein
MVCLSSGEKSQFDLYSLFIHLIVKLYYLQNNNDPSVMKMHMVPRHSFSSAPTLVFKCPNAHFQVPQRSDSSAPNARLQVPQRRMTKLTFIDLYHLYETMPPYISNTALKVNVTKKKKENQSPGNPIR